jgi:hypothetical protein
MGQNVTAVLIGCLKIKASGFDVEVRQAALRGCLIVKERRVSDTGPLVES